MRYALRIEGESTPEAAAEIEQALLRFAAHMRRMSGAGLTLERFNGVDVLAGRGTADNPVHAEPRLPDGWTHHPDGGYLDAQGRRVAARDGTGAIVAGLDEVDAQALEVAQGLIRDGVPVEEVVSISREDMGNGGR